MTRRFGFLLLLGLVSSLVSMGCRRDQSVLSRPALPFVNQASANPPSSKHKPDAKAEKAAQDLYQQLNQALGQKQEYTAKTILGKMLRRYRNTQATPTAYYNWAEYLRRNGDKERALQAYVQITKLFPTSSVASSAVYSIQSLSGEYLYLYTNRTFSPSDVIQVSVSSRGQTTLQMQLWEVDLLDYVKQGKNPHYPNLYEMKRRLVKQWEEKTQVPAWARRHYRGRMGYYYGNTNVRVPVKKAGTYLVFVNGKYTSAGALLLVSNYAMIVKRSSDRLLTFVSHRTQGQVGKQVAIEAWFGGKRVASGMTNEKGVLIKTMSGVPTGQVVVVGRVGKETLIADAHHWYSTSTQKVAMLYTDRPVYRPGQEVLFKIIARHRQELPEEARYTFQKGESIRVLVRAPRGGNLLDQTFKTGSFGTVNHSISLDKGANIGRYHVQATYGGQTFYAYFHVEAYKKPEYLVSVEPKKSFVVGGASVKVALKARYYFGQPVVDAPVEYRVYVQQQYYMPFFCGRHSWYYNPYVSSYYSGYRGSYVSGGRGKLNAKGQLLVTIPTQKAAHNQIYTIEAYVTDQSRRQISASGKFHVTRGEFNLRIRTDKYAYHPGENVLTTLITKDHAGKPIDTTVDVKVEVRKYEDGQWKQRVLYQKSVKTGATGEAHYKFVPDMQGYFLIRASARDSLGNNLEATHWLWYVGENYSSVYSYSGIDLTLDKDSYQVGDKAKIIITTGHKGHYALVTFEADQLYDYDVVKLSGNAMVLTRTLTQKDSPNVYVHVHGIFQSSFVSKHKMIVIPPVQKFLTVQIEPDKKHYEPGEPASFAVQLLDAQGKPVVGEVSVGVVDESLYAIRADHTADIRKHFYGLRQLRVSTYHSLYFWSYSRGGVVSATGGAAPAAEAAARPASPARRMAAKSIVAADKKADSGPKDDALVEARVRSKFVDTAHWSPSVVTDTQGKARVQFTMPDNLTTWRFTARVVTRDTLVGAGQITTLVKKDLLVRLQTPRTFTEKDVVTISGIVHNYLEREKRVVVDLTGTGGQLLGKTQHTVVVPPKADRRIDFRFRAEGPVSSMLRIRARTNEKSDAMELKIPVLPFGIRQVSAQAGKVDTSTSMSVQLPRTATQKTAQLKLVLSPSLAATMLDALEYLVGYPYGCVEQTMSRLLPNVFVAQVLQKLGIPNAKLQKELPKMVKKGVDRLFDLQQHHGGWGWWGYGESHPFMTAYALYGLTMARQADFAVDQYKLQRGLTSLRQMIQQEMSHKTDKYRPDTLAYMVHTLAFHEKPNTAILQRLIQTQGTLSNYGRALLYMTLRKVGQTEDASLIMKELLARVETSGVHAHWGGKTWRYSWTDNAIESTAYALKALVMENPKHPLIPKVIQYLLTERQGNRWTSTKDTAAVIYAFADYLKASGELRADYTFQVKVNGRVAQKAHITRDNLTTFRGILNLDGTWLRAGKNTIEFQKQGRGALYYSTFLTFYNRAQRLKPTSSGLKVARTYHLMRWEKNKHGQLVQQRTAYKGETIRSGQELEVSIEVSAPKQYQYLMVEDYIPAGTEIVKQQQPQHYSHYYYYRRHPFYQYGSHQEARDEKMVFFRTYVYAGKHTFTYRLRAETPGTFRTLPTYAELMYHTEITGTSDDITVKITD